MKTKSLLVLLLAVAGLCTSAQKQDAQPGKSPAFPDAGTHKHAKLSYKIIPAANNTYGYDIYSDGRRLIHQPTVPGMPGNEGFKTKEGAEKTAQLVISKIGKGEMPPTVSPEEMRTLKAIP